MAALTVEKLMKERREILDMTLLAGAEGVDRAIQTNEIFRPGLALAGYTDRFAYKRVQVFGETELTYLASLSPKQRTESIEKLTSFPVPVLVVTKGIAPTKEMMEVADRAKVPLLSTRMSTTDFITRLSTILDNVFAPSITKHGTLVDVWRRFALYRQVGNRQIGMRTRSRRARTSPGRRRHGQDHPQGAIYNHRAKQRTARPPHGSPRNRRNRYREAVRYPRYPSAKARRSRSSPHGLGGRFAIRASWTGRALHDCARGGNPGRDNSDFSRQEHHRDFRSDRHESHAQSLWRKRRRSAFQAPVGTHPPPADDDGLSRIGLRIDVDFFLKVPAALE